MKKRKMSQAWKNRIWNGSILAAFVAAMAVFVFLLQTEKRVLTEYEKEQVCVVTAAIPRGEKISAENAEQYITVMEIDKRIVPETALKSTEAASGRIAAYGVEQGTDYRHAAGTVGDHRTDAGTCYSRIPRRRSVPGSGRCPACRRQDPYLLCGTGGRGTKRETVVGKCVCPTGV